METGNRCWQMAAKQKHPFGPFLFLIGYNAIVFLVAQIFKANVAEKRGNQAKPTKFGCSICLLTSRLGHRPKSGCGGLSSRDNLLTVLSLPCAEVATRTSCCWRCTWACLISLQRLKNCLLSLLFSQRLCLIMTPC